MADNFTHRLRETESYFAAVAARLLRFPEGCQVHMRVNTADPLKYRPVVHLHGEHQHTIIGAHHSLIASARGRTQAEM
jgi:hypothetical protein